MASVEITQVDIDTAKTIVRLADYLGEPLAPGYRALAEAQPFAVDRGHREGPDYGPTMSAEPA